MSTNPLVNNALGMTDDLIGGSSLMWRYHHQVPSIPVLPQSFTPITPAG